MSILPQTISGYRILKRISEGGMGEVVLARREGKRGFEKKVAIKLLLPQFLESEEVKELFFSEARLAAQLSHPNVCQVFDFGEEANLYYIIMEFIDGVSVEDMLRHHVERRDKLSPELACRIVADAARGLHHAHTRRGEDGNLLGVVHRDVSPQNIIVTYDGCTKVLDFGIAKSRERVTTTQQGIVRGKPGYMSPEQTRADPLDCRSDIFSLGIVLHELLVNRPLFIRGNVYATINAISNDPIPDVRELVPGLPEQLSRIVTHALQRNSAERFASADLLARALDQLIAQLGRPAASTELADYLTLRFPPTKTLSSVEQNEPELDQGRPADKKTAVMGGQAEPADLGLFTENATTHPQTPSSIGQKTQSPVTARPVTAAIAAPNNRGRILLLTLLVVLATASGAYYAGLFERLTGSGDTASTLSAVGLDATLSFDAATAVVDTKTADATSTKADASVADSPVSTADQGTLVVRCSPKGLVWLDRSPLGPSPIKQKVTAGRHSLRILDPKSGDLWYKKTITIRKNRREKIVYKHQNKPTKTMDPEKADPPIPAPPKTYGILQVRAKPYGQVLLDGKPLGDTPVTRKVLTGEHLIEIIAPDTSQVRHREKVYINEGENKVVKIAE